MAVRLQSNVKEGLPVSGSFRIFGALLLGLVLGAGVGANAMTKASSTKHHSAGPVHVAAKGRARVPASRTGRVTRASTVIKKTRGASSRVVMTKTVVTRVHGHV